MTGQSSAGSEAAFPYGRRGDPVPPLGALSAPIDRATSYAFADARAIAEFGTGARCGEFYPRLSHHNGRRVEAIVAGLERCDGAVAFASGMAAMSGAILALCKAGDRVLVADRIYGGTDAIARHDLPRLGLQIERFDPLAPQALGAALLRPARLVVAETPINPTLRLVDLRALADAVHAAGALLLVDGTFAPPPIQQAIELGADLVVHSATKFLGGHSDLLAGVVAGRDELLGPIAAFRKRTGATLAPDVAWLLERSLATLRLRVAAQQESAAAIAAALAAEPPAALRAVFHPTLRSHPDHELCRRQMHGGGALLALDVAGGLAGAMRCYDRLAVIARAASLGGVESVASLPPHTTHVGLDDAQREAAGIPAGLIRVSVGLEERSHLLADLRQALARA
jgi:cystathionine beta-lyase/cystathionine gamma-synthase